MPIYEYKCDNKNCCIKIECLQKVSDKPLKICPECKEASLRKLVSAAGFRLKGQGWYETDFKNNKDKRKNLSVDNTCSNNEVKTSEKHEIKDTNTTKSQGSGVTGDKSSSVDKSSSAVSSDS